MQIVSFQNEAGAGYTIYKIELAGCVGWAPDLEGRKELKHKSGHLKRVYANLLLEIPALKAVERNEIQKPFEIFLEYAGGQ